MPRNSLKNDPATGDSVQVETVIPVTRRERARPGAKKAKPPEPAAPKIPRLTRLMALAIKFQDMIDRGEVKDYAEIAELGYVTRARVTQIMNLTLLAPDIQEEIIQGSVQTGTPAYERVLRRIARHPGWEDQRRGWEALKASRRVSSIDIPFSANPLRTHIQPQCALQLHPARTTKPISSLESSTLANASAAPSEYPANRSGGGTVTRFPIEDSQGAPCRGFQRAFGPDRA